jgi:hypothetical protein
MKKLAAFLLALLLLGGSALAQTILPSFESAPERTEIYRLKIVNTVSGEIAVSRDQGFNWEPIGSVLRPAGKADPAGFAAARWAIDGSVAAVAVNALHIKVSPGVNGAPAKIFSLLPAELAVKPKNYRSYYAPTAAIQTDIPAGSGIFGGEFSPFVGDLVLVSEPARPIVPLPKGYSPKEGDIFYIIVERPVAYPKEIVIENKTGGRVLAYYFGLPEKLIGRVVKPVGGIGRFEGSLYAYPGRLRANHPGVLDIATSTYGRLGGFQIIPSRHAADLGYPMSSPQWLVIAPVPPESALEGRAPFFKYFMRPVYNYHDLADEEWEEKILGRFLIEGKIKGVEGWQPLPVQEFRNVDLSQKPPLWANKALADLEALRILFPITTK